MGRTKPTLLHGMERSFATQVAQLRLGAGETFRGETILALTKALLQAGVGYVGGYPGAPISHLMDVLAEASGPILEPLGVQFEQSASEAGAAALLGASIHYPLRGAVTWKSIVGTNVASDALSNLASAGVTGGALIIIGDDYGEGASVIQERTHATAMKSSLPLLDPRYHMPLLVDLTERAFELSEACNLPVMMSLRIRAAHMTGSFTCRDNRPPTHGPHNPIDGGRFDYGKIVLPPSTYAQERDKVERRLPAARRFIVEHGINERFDGAGGSRGIILQGGTYGVVMRALAQLGLADAYGDCKLPLLVLNAVHPLVPEQITDFLTDMDDVLIVEEGTPAFIEHEIRALAQQTGTRCRIAGKGVLPEAGEYLPETLRRGIAAWLETAGESAAATRDAALRAEVERAIGATPAPVPARPPSFCTGCPERPIFAALKLLQRERGALHISSDIGCSTFSTLPPFNIGSTVLGYGMSLASGGAVGPALGKPIIAVMGDGGFWHNGITSGAANAQWNRHNAVLILLENGYASATGQQHIPSTGSTPAGTPVTLSIEQTLRGMGVTWIRRVDAYDVEASLATLRAALDADGGLRVVISDQECRLAYDRRARRTRHARAERKLPVTIARFGVDAEACTGDHACMRLSGCPSLTLRPATDPLKDGPTAHVDASCVGCGLCGANAHAAALCPSFYEARRTTAPNHWMRARQTVEAALMRLLGAS